MIDDPGEADPWAWAREKAADAAPDLSGHSVAAIVVTHDGERWIPSLLSSLRAQLVRPHQVVIVDAGSSAATEDLLAAALRDGTVDRVERVADGSTFGASVAAAVDGIEAADWLWLLHDDATADVEALARLLTASVRDDADVVGPVLLEPRRRRGRAARISEAGQTITRSGVITGVVADGVLDQGQLDGGDVLGLNSAGLLVRREAWDALGGFDVTLPSTVQGLEFCWRARAAGRRVVVEPTARLVHWQASQRGLRSGRPGDPELDRRRWGLALHEAFRTEPLGAAERAGLAAASTRRVIGLVAGKDVADARAERRAVREWRADRAAVERLRGRYAEAARSNAGTDTASALRLSAKASRARRLDETFGRFVDWFASFGDRGGGPGLDALTGDDFARDDQTKRRLSPSWIVAWVLALGALAASRSLLVGGALTGPQLLPVPDAFSALFAQYAQPVPGVGASAGAPWLGLLWVASLVTFGHPDLVVSVLLLGAVPLLFVLARRVLGRLATDPWVAIGGAAVYALVPVLTGAVGSGQLGTICWAFALPVFGHAVLRWWDDRRATWQVVGAAGLAATVLVAAEPSTWLLVAAILVAVGLRCRGWWQVAVAALAPALLLVSPYTAELARFPGRLLTGIEPLLAPDTTLGVVEALLGRGAAAAPVWWIGLLTFGNVWLIAIVGAVLRRGRAAWLLAAALCCAAIAIGLTHLVVSVPPAGVLVRPQASAWLIAMAAALIWAGADSVDQAREEIAGSTADARHLLVYAAALVTTVAVVSGAVWWVLAGQASLSRSGASDIPAFMRKDAAKGASRTLALHFAGDAVRWALLEDDLGTLGDAERGLAFGGSPRADALASSVVRRLAVGAADERILPDLQALGVGYVWAAGASADQRTGITNSPGIGTGATDDAGTGWAVPDSGRLVVLHAGQRSKIEPGAVLAAAPTERTLVLAEPTTEPPVVTVGGVALAQAAPTDGSPTYAIPASGPGSSGSVVVQPAGGFPGWAVAQAVLLLALLLLAAPAAPSAGRAQAPAPRRAGRGSDG